MSKSQGNRPWPIWSILLVVLTFIASSGLVYYFQNHYNPPDAITVMLSDGDCAVDSNCLLRSYSLMQMFTKNASREELIPISHDLLRLQKKHPDFLAKIASDLNSKASEEELLSNELSDDYIEDYSAACVKSLMKQTSDLNYSCVTITGSEASLAALHVQLLKNSWFKVKLCTDSNAHQNDK